MRLIDADALENAMYHEAFETDSDMQKWDSGCWIRYKMFEKHLANAPTVSQWIPCSERLPEYGEKVLTYDGVTCWVEARIPFVLDEKGEELRAEWWVSDDVDHEKRYYPNLRDGAAIAWMPLPEAWKGEEK